MRGQPDPRRSTAGRDLSGEADAARKSTTCLLADGFVEDLEVEVPDGHAGGNRNRLPVEVILRALGSGRAATRCGSDAGRWLSPLSSMKTIVRPSFWAFF